MTDAVRDLVAGADFRQPEHRRGAVHRFYEFHLRYRSHPGCVYYVMPWLRDACGWSPDEALWYAFLNGHTQNPVTSLVVHRLFPTPRDADALADWYPSVYSRLAYDTDRRYHRPHLAAAAQHYAHLVEHDGQEQFWMRAAERGFSSLWKTATALPTFGRLSAFSYLEYLQIMGAGLPCDTLMLDDHDGSRSHRNGLSIVLGRDDLDWHASNPTFDGVYAPATIEWLTGEADALLAEAHTRMVGTDYARDVGCFTLESALCTYKSWHRPNRRYPNVYNDLLHDRIREGEREWGEEFDVLWQAREATLPRHLRLESSPRDPGCQPIKQNYYLRTGCPVMMHRDWPCFANDLNAAIDNGAL